MNSVTPVVRAKTKPDRPADANGSSPVCEISPNLQAVLSALEKRLGTQKFNAWFRHGLRLTLEGDVLRVFASNAFAANWIDTHYSRDLSAVATEQLALAVTVSVAVDHGLTGDLRKRQRDSQATAVDMAVQGRARSRQAGEASPLRHRLEGFVIGESNRLAYTSATAMLGETPPFNLLFIHGSCGVGKTHLLQGVCNLTSRGVRGGRVMKCRYVTGEQFTNEFIQSLRAKKIEEFRARYRSLDLLAIDDVHFLSAKKATQDEFLHTFNAIESAGKLILMASDAHPRLVGEMNEQLTSRFLSGMVVKVGSPDEALRGEILRRRAKEMKLNADAEALAYVAQHVRGSVRELEGAMFKLSAIAALSGSAVTRAVAAEALADHLARGDSAVTLGGIEAIVSAFFGITQADLHSSRRTRTVSTARMVAMFLARRHTRMSFPEIGKAMGKNHSSVVLAVQKMEAALAENADLDWLSPMGTKTMPASDVVQVLAEQL
ncbi:MAG: chromosomal replication initiator protein DnaA [Phycisphaerae bacterium]|nr:chromosomal replication initiator protein DnaA [Phycisphaerae bacterium]